MGETLFFTSLLVIFVLFIMRTSVARFIFQNTGLGVSTRGVTIALICAVAFVFILGVITADQKGRYASISDAFGEMRPTEPKEDMEDSKQEPHRWFSFDFNFFNF